MFRSSCVVLLIFLSFVGSSAQSVQVKAGINATKVTGERASAFRKGFYVGVAKDIPLSKRISFHPELFYSMQGTVIDNGQPSRYRYHYLQMPLFFNFMFEDRWGINFGPQIGLLSRAKVVTDRDETYVITPVMNPFDVQIGGGPYLKFGRVTAELRTTIGLTQIDRKYEQWRTFGLQAGVSWSFIKPGEAE